MATANTPTGPEHIRCLLCNREYDAPRTLPCNHAYCEKCLSSHTESAGLEQTDIGTQFDCPACRRCIQVSDSSLSEGTTDMLGSLVKRKPVGATEGGGDLTGRSLVTSQHVGATGAGGDLTGRSLVTSQHVGATGAGGDLTGRSLVTSQHVGATGAGGDLTGRSLVTSQHVGDTGGGDDMMKATTKKVKSVTKADIEGGEIFTGGAYLAVDSLLICDCENTHIIYVDSEYKVVTKIKIRELPHDVAYSDKHRTALVRTVTGILKYSVTGAGLHYKGKVTLPTSSSFFCGIAVHNDTIIVATGYSLKLLTMGGNVQKTIYNSRGLGVTTCVAVCSDLERFCYPDDDVIVCCDIDGTERFRYGDTNLALIRGVAFDRWGHIYACCWGPKCHVHQISPDGQRGRELMLDQSNIKLPWGIACHPTKDEIVVISYKDSVALEVFTLT